jgi:hypothetical protein
MHAVKGGDACDDKHGCMRQKSMDARDGKAWMHVMKRCGDAHKEMCGCTQQNAWMHVMGSRCM